MNYKERMKYNSKMAYEVQILHDAKNQELASMGYGYDNYHWKEYYNISSISSKYCEILNLSEPKSGAETVYSYVSKVRTAPALSREQRKQLDELRKQPEVIRVFGLTALQQQINLEDVLGSKISNNSGIAIVGEYAPDAPAESVPIQTFKSEKTIDREFDGYQTVLSQALKDGKINDEIYESYSRDLGYIQDYFISQSRGEQVECEKISDAELEKIEEETNLCGSALQDEMSLRNEIRIENFIECQQASSEMQDGPSQ